MYIFTNTGSFFIYLLIILLFTYNKQSNENDRKRDSAKDFGFYFWLIVNLAIIVCNNNY